MYVAITPIGKPRQTQRDRWAKRPVVLRYRQFCDDLREAYTGPLPAELTLIFYIPMPPSWSKRKKAEMLGQPHQAKPDIDNLCKSVMDALCEDDSYVHTLHATKLWSDTGGIAINQ